MKLVASRVLFLFLFCFVFGGRKAASLCLKIPTPVCAEQNRKFINCFDLVMSHLVSFGNLELSDSYGLSVWGFV